MVHFEVFRISLGLFVIMSALVVWSCRATYRQSDTSPLSRLPISPAPKSKVSSMARLEVGRGKDNKSLLVTITNTMRKKTLPVADLGPGKSLRVICESSKLITTKVPWAPTSSWDILRVAPHERESASLPLSDFIEKGTIGRYKCRLEYQDIIVLHMGPDGVVGSIRSNVFEVVCNVDGSCIVTNFEKS
jgi:hypothetical protein